MHLIKYLRLEDVLIAYQRQLLIMQNYALRPFRSHSPKVDFYVITVIKDLWKIKRCRNVLFQT